MANNLSYAEANKIITNWQGRILEVALYTTTPTKDSAGVEVADAGYSRQTVTLSNGVTIGGTGVRTANSAQLNFGTAVAPFTITGYAVIDTADSGVVWFANLDSNLSVVAGQPVSVAADKLGIIIK